MALSIVVATQNPAKNQQLRALLSGLNVTFLDEITLDERNLSAIPEVTEKGQTHLANAIEKAVAWARASNATSIASDGGLSIPALGAEWSSLITRRGTGQDVSDEERAARLLRRMRDLDDERRACYWTEAVAVARSGELVGAWEESGLRGCIAPDYVPPAGGTNGFWVSGLWVTETGRRRWQLSDDELLELGDPWGKLASPVRDLIRRLGEPDAPVPSNDQPVAL